jgi:MarR family
MSKNSRDPVHCWLVLVKAFQAASKYLYAGLAETGIDDTDFRILEALLNKGPLPVNTIGPKVFLPPGSISVAIDRLLDRGLVSRVESPEDRASGSCRSPKKAKIDRAGLSEARRRNYEDLCRCKAERVASS